MSEAREHAYAIVKRMKAHYTAIGCEWQTAIEDVLIAAIADVGQRGFARGVEAAAKVCDLIADGAATRADEEVWEDKARYNNQCVGADKCAKAIRAFAPANKPEEG